MALVKDLNPGDKISLRDDSLLVISVSQIPNDVSVPRAHRGKLKLIVTRTQELIVDAETRVKLIQ